MATDRPESRLARRKRACIAVPVANSRRPERDCLPVAHVALPAHPHGSRDGAARTEQATSRTSAGHANAQLMAATRLITVDALVLGTGLLVFADAPALHVLGVAALIVFAISGSIRLMPTVLPEAAHQTSDGSR